MKQARWLSAFQFVVVAAALAAIFNNCAEPRLQHFDLATAVSVDFKGGLCANPRDPMTPVTMTSFQIVNLNMAFNKGHLEADSDGDGIPDTLEAALGYDPLKRRSNDKILDGVCQMLGGPSQCADFLKGSTCAAQVNGAGMSDCDVQSLNLQLLFPHPDQGIDSDKDGVLDVVEINRGLFPNRDDLGDDPDGDGITNQQELALGLDPRTPDAQSPATQQISVSRDDTLGCTGAGYTFSINKMAIGKTQAFTDTDVGNATAPAGRLNYSHDVNENLILITYKTVPYTPTGSAQVWAALKKVTYGTALPVTVAPSDFHLIGTVLK